MQTGVPLYLPYLLELSHYTILNRIYGLSPDQEEGEGEGGASSSLMSLSLLILKALVIVKL
jgi:hypothetical protein